MGAFYSDYVCFAHHIHGDIYLYWFPKKNSTLSLLYKMDFKSFLEFQWNAICQVIACNDKESWIKMNSFFVVYMMRVCLLGNLGLPFSHKKKRWSSHKPHLSFSFSAYLIPKAPTPSPEPIQPQLLARPLLIVKQNWPTGGVKKFLTFAQLRRLKHLLLIRSLIRDNINFDCFLPDWSG